MKIIHKSMTLLETICPRRVSHAKASIRLRWALAGHPVSTLQMHGAFRTLKVNKWLRPRNVSEFRFNWTLESFTARLGWK